MMILDRYGLSDRRACDLIGLARSTFRYQAQEDATNQWLKSQLVNLAASHLRYGYRHLYVLLRRDGHGINHKRVYRQYTILGLAVRRKKRKKVSQANRRPRIVPERANEQWSMDFVSDVLVNGRRLRALNIVDDATRQCPGIEVDISISGAHVARVLDRIGQQRGLPRRIVVDNGPEFTSHALDQWAYENAVELVFIRPGRPVENCFIESFNGKFRDECLNLHWFKKLEDAREIIETWRHEYNHFRPHSSLGWKTPAEFAEESGLRPTPSTSVLIPPPTGSHEDHQPC